MFTSLPRFRKFSAITALNILSLSLLFLEFKKCEYYFFSLLPIDVIRFLHFLILFFFLLFYWKISHILSSGSLILSTA